MRKKLIIHIGYPKTGTTSLQLNLFKELMVSGKIEYLNHLNKKVDFLGDIFCGKTLAYVMGMSSIRNFEDELNAFKKITNPVSVISNENLSFFCSGFSWAYQSANAADNAKRISEVFSPYFDTIEVLMFVREQSSMIQSFYAQQYNHIIAEEPKFVKVDKWMKANFIAKCPAEKLIFDYNFIYNSFSNVLGVNNIKLFLFEDLKNNPSQIASTLSEVFGVERDFVLEAISESKQKNKTMTNQSNGLIASSSDLTNILSFIYRKYFKVILSENNAKKIKNSLVKPFASHILNFKLQNKIHCLNDEQVSAIKSLYGESNYTLSKLDTGLKDSMIQYKYLSKN